MTSRASTRPHTSRGEPLIPVVDLFAGAGGLGEGFSASEEVAGTGRFRIALSIEKDPTAHSTLELRALFRQFDHGEVPDEYYAFVRGKIDRETLFAAPAMAAAAPVARAEAWQAELGEEPAHNVVKRVSDAVKEEKDRWVLVGGPPCQAYSLVGRSRNRGNPDYNANADGRHTLYRQYLQVIATQWPAAFVMENVKGLLSARLGEQSIFTRILEDLHEPDKAVNGKMRTRESRRYRIIALSIGTNPQVDMFDHTADPKRFIVRCENYGVPQARHRIILLGIRGDIQLDGKPNFGLLKQPEIPAAEVLRDLPQLRSGVSDRDDSPEAWRDVLASCLAESWFAHLRASEPDMAGQMELALAKAGRARLTRGGEFVAREARARKRGEWYFDPRLKGVANHATRSHIAEDLKRYLFASAFAKFRERSPTLSDFPKGLLPNHRNVDQALKGSMFQDRFRVQLAGRPSTTVTSHISKDGHYYIHYDPSQCRSLTAREAARLQTFPDNYFFCGGRTAQYQQIGNAVPPLLAVQIARIVASILG